MKRNNTIDRRRKMRPKDLTDLMRFFRPHSSPSGRRPRSIRGVLAWPGNKGTYIRKIDGELRW